ncbi:MAG: NFACT family protein [Firmicutes bacterium]|nr:NFACT family protein [Bacillota bacterium]
MAFDGMVTTAVVAELNEKLLNGKIDKIYQPAAEEIVLQVHCGREKYRLYISANTNHASVYLMNEKSSNPQTPPAFCMLLRKHLNQARIREIRQVDSERIVEIYTDAVNELGFNVNHKLVIEIMGKHSNILLIDLKTGKILDCIKRISGDVNRYRQTLPGLMYVAPPSHDKIPYFGLSYDAFCDATPDLEQAPEKVLLRGIQGISPVMSSELCYRAQCRIAGTDGDFRKAVYAELCEAVQTATSGAAAPVIYKNEAGAPAEFHALPLTVLEGTYEPSGYESISEACAAYFEGRASSNRIKQKSLDIHRAVSNGLDKLLLKKQRLNEDLLKAENSEELRLFGELLTASLHTVKEGRNSAEVLNYYTGEMISIPLDPRFTATQNAQRYFKKYGKSKTAITEKTIQLKDTEEEITYLDSVLTFIEDARNVDDLEDIRAELVENGFLKKRNSKEKDRKLKFKPLEYHTTSGKRILVGRNNKENDMLTFKTASSRDIWMHTKDIPGSHVVLFTEGEEPTAEEIFETAALAALHSKAKLSSQVPVDYVNIKHVKKPSGSKPGFVVFTHNNTVYVTPGEPGAEK